MFSGIVVAGSRSRRSATSAPSSGHGGHSPPTRSSSRHTPPATQGLSSWPPSVTTSSTTCPAMSSSGCRSKPYRRGSCLCSRLDLIHIFVVTALSGSCCSVINPATGAVSCFAGARLPDDRPHWGAHSVWTTRGSTRCSGYLASQRLGIINLMRMSRSAAFLLSTEQVMEKGGGDRPRGLRSNGCHKLG
uniref:Uncharacterized protein n=1 Tax=Setaria viridis TaxID=4556 RepID=A0A4U6U3Y5_SETVI|nr:hypothetical protein SEVIR_6G148400v2 [Setaria viridis]TKW10228.1 hypothetical protein SEVIR_6G148400v2 [Setaria viridis]